VNSSHFWRDFQWLFAQGLVLFRWPVFGWAGLIVACGLLVLFLWQKPHRKGLWKQSYWLVFTQLLFYPAIIAVGVYLQQQPPYYLPQPKIAATGTLIIKGLVYTSLALSLFWVFKMKGLRWYAFCFLAFLQFLLYGAWFVAECSMTGWP
jgi:hypothetical protein